MLKKCNSAAYLVSIHPQLTEFLRCCLPNGRTHARTHARAGARGARTHGQAQEERINTIHAAVRSTVIIFDCRASITIPL